MSGGSCASAVAQIADQPIVGRPEIDADDGMPKWSASQPRVRLVARIAVARHDDADDLSRRRHLAQPRDDRRIDPAAEADDEPARAGAVDTLPQPSAICVRVADASCRRLHPRSSLFGGSAGGPRCR